MGLCVTTFLVTFVSGFLPLVNAEAYIASVSVLARGANLGAVVAAATCGQMAAKTVLYLTSRGLLRLPLRQRGAHPRRVVVWLERGDARAVGLVFVSALSGLPPFFAVTLAAGALGFPLSRFVAMGALGRLMRFGALFLASRLL